MWVHDLPDDVGSRCRFTIFGQFVVFLTPSIQMAQIMVSGGRIAQKLATLQLVDLLHARALSELLISQLKFLFSLPMQR